MSIFICGVLLYLPQFHQIIRKKSELNRVLMNLVKNSYVFAQKRQNPIFDVFFYVRRELHKIKEIVQDVNHRITIIMYFTQDLYRLS